MLRHLIRRSLAILLLVGLSGTLLPASAAHAEGAADIAVLSQPAFTAPGAVVSVELMVTGTSRVDSLYARYDFQRMSWLSSGRYRTPDAGGTVGLNLLQWAVPTTQEAGDALWYRIVAVTDGDAATAPAPPLENCIPFGRRLNAGSTSIVPDGSASSWEPDRAWFHNAYGYEGVTTVITTSEPVRGTTGYGEDDLYQHQRVSVDGRPFHYRFYYGTGIYQARLQVDLHFAELEATAPGQRVFDVLVDGRPLITGLDIYAVAGPRQAYVVSCPVTVTYRLGVDPVLDIAFVPRIGEAAVAGISIRSLSAVPQYVASARVAQSADDTHVILDDGNYNREPFVRFGRYSDGFEYAAGLLFRRLPVPQGAFVSSAWLEVWSYPAVGWQYGQADVTVYAQAADSAGDFNWNQPRATARPLTAHGVRWSIDRSWSPNKTYRSVDLAAAVQDVVDRARWRPGNSLALLLMPGRGAIGWRDIVASDWPGDAEPEDSQAAVLYVTFVPPPYRPDQP